MARAASWMFLALSLAASPVAAASKPVEIQVSTPRVSLADVMQQRKDLAVVDLGLAPGSGGTRLVTKRQMMDALERAKKAGHEVMVNTSKLPKSVRFVRKMELITPAQLERMVRAALRPPTGVTLVSAGLKRGVRVPAGWKIAKANLPKHPRRVGNWSTSIRLQFTIDGATIAVVSVPAKLSISKLAAQPDIARGAAVTVIVRRGRVEIRARGVANSSADIGDVFPVRIGKRGKVLQAKLLSGSSALVVAK